MTTSFAAVLKALKNNNSIAIDDHYAHMPNPADREVKVEVIASFNGDAVFLEDLDSIAGGYSVNRMRLDEDGSVHITKSSVMVLTGLGLSIPKAIERHNSYDDITEARMIKHLTYLAKSISKFEIGESSCLLNREIDGMYSVYLNEFKGVNSVSFHETKVKGVAEFKKNVEAMLVTL